ncbi:hypothetical protein E3O06_05585 [Cryobacterium glaciale]|uniref:Uncharacterized protein n=1 Tax=Cryobacterium glaciale TaxID=1259145 RepID=A0A4V3I9H2_9MICO|nr:hypothetical protein [Cryobacterium glaciale]TFB75297.1 hypothetical protein E3O06_05585 [Cryobacterium glaciale]
MDQLMQSYRLTINGDWFYLSNEYNIADLKATLAAAVHSGGGFVDIVSSVQTHVSLLITACSVVKLETIVEKDLPDVAEGVPTVGPTYVDGDYWLD